MAKLTPEYVTELRVTIPPHNTCICLGLFEKQIDVLRAIRLVENNNDSIHYKFEYFKRHNPKLIDVSLKSKVY